MSSNPPKTIYHYCSLESFLNIVKSKKLYLSSTTCMNDYLESRWIKNSINKFTKEIWKKDKAKWLFVNPVKKLISQYLDGGFIASFSQHEDMLSQWRGYACDGTGVAIGINTKTLKAIHHQSNYNLSLNKVIYNQTEQQETVNEIFHRYYNLANTKDVSADAKKLNHIYSLKMKLHERVKISNVLTGNLNYTEQRNYFMHKCAAELLTLSLSFKNNAFLEESEYRICYFPDFKSLEKTSEIFPLFINAREFRISNNRIIPFYSANFSTITNFFSEIVLGPKCKVDTKIIRNLLKNYEMGNPKIKKSKASYQ